VVAGLIDWIFTRLPNTTIARLLRLVKLGRGMRLVKMSKVLDSLHLILKCIASSVITLFWAFGLLGVTQCVAAMVFSQLVHPYLENNSKPLLDRQEVYSYYGTFTRSMLTMFEIMLANWAPSCRVLVNKVSESYSILFVLYRCCAGFAVLNVINAVFIQQTLKVAQNDKDVMIMQKQRAQEEYIKKLQALFQQLDTSGDNLLSLDEFEHVLTDKKLKAWLSALEVDTADLQGFFNILADGDGQIAIDDFVIGISRLKGFAKAIDVANLVALVKRLDVKVECLAKRHAHPLKSAGRKGTRGLNEMCCI